MSIVWQDGFDLYTGYSDLAMAYSSSGGSFSTNGGRFGGGAFQTGNYGITRPITPNVEFWSACAINTSSANSGDKVIMAFLSNSGPEVQFNYNPSTGHWTAYLGSNNTLLGSATQMLGSGWHWVDCHMKMDGSAGVVEMWLDEVQLFSVSGINTIKNAGQTQISAISLSDNNSGQGLNAYYDDWVINNVSGSINNGRMGDCRIETLLPSSDASPNNGTPSTAGSHYAMVNDAQWNSSNYITMPNTSGDKEVYGHGALSGTPAVVKAVRVLLVSEKSDAGSFFLEPLVISSGTEGDGSSQQLTTTWGIQSSIFETDPHTNAAWAYGAVNSASIGYKVP